MKTLFHYHPEYHYSIYIEQCKKRYGLNISEQFVHCANIQLTRMFEKLTGFKINKNVSIGWVSPPFETFFVIKGEVSKYSSEIWVNHSTNLVTILWKSHSGRIYEMHDEDIDCADIEFWFEGIDPVLYNKQMFPKDELPFRLKGLSYELVVTRLNLDCIMTLTLKEKCTDTDGVIKQIDEQINAFNVRSEKKDREDGVIHNWKHYMENGRLIYEIDTGSAGMIFFKKLLKFLSKLDCFTQVQIG